MTVARGHTDAWWLGTFVVLLAACPLPEPTGLPCSNDDECGTQFCVEGACSPDDDATTSTSTSVGPGDTGTVADTGTTGDDSTTAATGMVGDTGTSTTGGMDPDCPEPETPYEGNHVRRIALGELHSCAVLDDLTLKCWGRNRRGQLGLGSDTNAGDAPGTMGENLEVVKFAKRDEVERIGGGGQHTCVVMDDVYSFERSGVRCWGDNGTGQLGLGQDIDPVGTALDDMTALPEIDLGLLPQARNVVTGQAHACAVLEDRRVKCWGVNDLGQVGLENPLDDVGRGDEDMGDDLLYVNFGAGLRTDQVCAGDDHTCLIVRDTGTIRCWGDNARGQLGVPSAPKHVGKNVDSMGDWLEDVALAVGDQAMAIACGGQHTCALLDSGQIKCWGHNDAGQLGLEDGETSIGDAPGEMDGSLMAVELGLGVSATAVTAGDQHTCALLSGSTQKSGMKCWGGNGRGQLGLGRLGNVGKASGDMGQNLDWIDLGDGVFATQIAAGGYHTCALLDDETIKCWGANHWGQLGQEHDLDRGLRGCEMGNALPRARL